jgi:hypothetical protein
MMTVPRGMAALRSHITPPKSVTRVRKEYHKRDQIAKRGIGVLQSNITPHVMVKDRMKKSTRNTVRQKCRQAESQ